jgi:hypothetical protein
MFRFFETEKCLGGSVVKSGVPGILNRTDECSELKSNILLVGQYKRLRIFEIKISRISGFLN